MRSASDGFGSSLRHDEPFAISMVWLPPGGGGSEGEARGRESLRGEEASMTATIDRAGGARVGSGFPTVASRVRDWATSNPDGDCDAREGLRHLAGAHLGADSGMTSSPPPTACSPSASDVGDVVSIHSEDRPEWVILDLADGRDPRHHHRAVSDQPDGRGRSTCSTTPAPRSTSPRIRSRSTRSSKPGPTPFPSVTNILYVEPRGARHL